MSGTPGGFHAVALCTRVSARLYLYPKHVGLRARGPVGETASHIGRAIPIYRGATLQERTSMAPHIHWGYGNRTEGAVAVMHDVS